MPASEPSSAFPPSPPGAAEDGRSGASPAPPEGPGSRFLRTAAYAVIVIAGLKAAGSLLVPVLAAALLAVLCLPLMRALQRRGLPNAVGLLIVILGLFGISAGLTGVLAGSIRTLTRSLPAYEARLDELLAGWATSLERFGLSFDPQALEEHLDTGALVKLAGQAAEGALTTLSQVLVILLITAFILLEASGFAAKLRRAKGDPGTDLSGYGRITGQVADYVSIKTLVSLLTGVLAGLLTWALGVDFPVLWGLLAFLFNFVPNIGSILAAIPAVLLALVLNGGANALLVGAGYLVINMAVGNVLEPRVMGRRLGLSPLVVLLSLIFWGWVFGPVGMILSLPMTMVVKILLEASGDYRAAAILLGPAVDENQPGKP